MILTGTDAFKAGKGSGLPGYSVQPAVYVIGSPGLTDCCCNACIGSISGLDLPVDRDQMLTTVSLYWFTGSGATAAHTLYEQAHSVRRRAADPTAGLRGLRRRRDGPQAGPRAGRRALDRVPARQALPGDGGPGPAGGGSAGLLRAAAVTEVLSLRGQPGHAGPPAPARPRRHQHRHDRAPGRDAAQAPLAPYVGLWTRLRLHPGRAVGTDREREVVRPNMRATPSTSRGRDCLDWRALFDPLMAASSAQLRRAVLTGVDRDVLPKRAGWPPEERRTRGELASELAAYWPAAEPGAGVRGDATSCRARAPPRGIWGKNGPPPGRRSRAG